ncbi:MAG TPA: tetratricopeptide repeat protein [Vicinamibacterales bacterium]|nr:tetratricopeptide repeat protein [Vicinamibacterales bacterium]
MRAQTHRSTFSAINLMMGVSGVFLGVIAGYVIAVGQMPPGAVATAGVPDDQVHTTAPSASLVNEEELKAYRDILASDPKNLKANVGLGNRLYDAGRFAEAIPYYRQALALDPKNVNVSTDLGTAMYYSGSVDEALTQLQHSLAIDPSHAQTLYNLGIIRRNGKNDARGAVEAWTELLEVAPGYPDAARVRALIDQTKS